MIHIIYFFVIQLYALNIAQMLDHGWGSYIATASPAAELLYGASSGELKSLSHSSETESQQKVW